MAWAVPMTVQDSADGYFANWLPRVTKTQAEQPHWITPLFTTTPPTPTSFRDRDTTRARRTNEAVNAVESVRTSMMRISSRRGTIVFFLCLGIGLVALAVALNVGWIILNWREGVLLFFGIVFFALIIAGMVVNTIFLVRELRRSEQHDSFINAVTHELKTPVASIRLHLETLQRREVAEHQKQEFYRLMLSDTDRLTETVEQVLRAGRAGDKKTGREKTEVDFGQLVRDCMDATRSRHHLPPEAVRYQEASNNGSGLRVRGNAEDLRTAVSNVLDNAVKYSGDTVDVRVQLETPDEKRIVLRVQDQGVGIPPEDVKRIFRRFYRVTHRSLAHVKGTGLGLFIVKAIAKKHGGKVFAESEGEGQGATIVLELPRRAE
jgi:two-component system, OmpR family, sensor histidine kinase SenX3